MVFMTQDLFAEIRKFLAVHLNEENLSASCRLKLINILSKLEIYDSSEINTCEDYHLYEEPCKSATLRSNFELPKKCIKAEYLKQNITLSGPLYYRYNLQCWEHYPSSILADGRLLCSKSSSASNTPQSSEHVNAPNSGKNTDQSIFLMGYSAIMTGKDCGMNFVFKLTHPVEDTKVFACETNEEAVIWIQQINQYSMGSSPTDIVTFRDHSETSKEEVDNVDAISTRDLPNYDEIHLRRQLSDTQTSIKSATISNPNFLISDVKFNRSHSTYTCKSGSAGNNQSSLSHSFSANVGTSIISSMRKKVGSLSNKYRNRKSFSGFSSKMFMSNGIEVNKSKTISALCNDENRRASMYSAQFIPISKDTIYKGIAKLRVQGNKTGWMERMCQLKPKLLECYHSSSNGLKATLDFALCLEDLTLGVSNDKKHKSALRLSCDKAKQDLLFEVQDKIVMGDWIKAFIEALGIGSRKETASNLIEVIDLTSNNGEKVEEDIMQKSLIAIRSGTSESIYDEVCSPYSNEVALPTILMRSPLESRQYQRRWSSPIIDLSQQTSSAAYAAKRCIKDHPLPSLPASSTDSENNSDTLSDTPNEDNKFEIEPLYGDSSTVGSNNNHSCTSTLRTRSKNQIYKIDECLRTSTMRTGYENDSLISKDHWNVHGYSLADLVARFESESENQDTSSATMSSKTDSTCTPTNQSASYDDLNSISNSILSYQSFAGYNFRKVARSKSADTKFDIRRLPKDKVIRKERPRSLLAKKTLPELDFEELNSIKEDLRSLNKQRTELQRVRSHKPYTKAASSESLDSSIVEVINNISNKQCRLKELSNNSRKRFTIEVDPKKRSPNSALLHD